MSNMELWDKVFKTDPRAVKPITGKQYKGNSPKPYWLIQRATEVFGACGIGWGVDVVSERFERLTDIDVLHVAHVKVWFFWGGKRGEVAQMGQTKAVYQTKNGMLVDEDAPKKSVTDGMVKALSMLGFAGDIFSGRWDDSKYVSDTLSEFVEAETPRIGDAELSQLRALISETKTDEAAFCKYLRVDKLDKLPLSSFAGAIDALNKKLKSVK